MFVRFAGDSRECLSPHLLEIATGLSERLVTEG